MAIRVNQNPQIIPYKKDPFQIVCLADDAIDTDKCSLEKYQETRLISDLVAKPGMQFTIFEARFLTMGLWTAFYSHYYVANPDKPGKYHFKTPALLGRDVFKQCITRVTNHVDPNGQLWPVLEPTEDYTNPDTGLTQKVWSNDQLNKYFGFQLETMITEVGVVAFGRHFLVQGLSTKFGY